MNHGWLRVATLMMLLALVFGSVAVAQDNEMRTWWSLDGSESLRASLDGFDKKTKVVSLRDQNDEIVTVKITQLSRADRSYVARSNRKKANAKREASDEASLKEDDPREPKKKRQVRTLQRFGVNWTKSIDDALVVASDEEVRKPVMWFRVLGDLKGLM